MTEQSAWASVCCTLLVLLCGEDPWNLSKLFPRGLDIQLVRIAAPTTQHFDRCLPQPSFRCRRCRSTPEAVTWVACAVHPCWCQCLLYLGDKSRPSEGFPILKNKQGARGLPSFRHVRQNCLYWAQLAACPADKHLNSCTKGFRFWCL